MLDAMSSLPAERVVESLALMTQHPSDQKISARLSTRLSSGPVGRESTSCRRSAKQEEAARRHWMNGNLTAKLSTSMWMVAAASVFGMVAASCDQPVPRGPAAPTGPGGRYVYNPDLEEKEEQPAHYAMTDQNVEAAVASAMLADEGVPSQQIDVTVEDRIVKLTGMVKTLAQKQRAADLAAAIKGVRSVVNNLKVKPTTLSDGKLKERVEAALTLDPTVNGFEISVTVEEGVATLEGNVDSRQEMELAEDVAARVAGIGAIQNKIKVSPAKERPDDEILNEVVAGLEMDVRVDPSLLQVSVEDGKVMLAGVVGSAAAKSRAIENAWVAGVDEVDATNLEAEWRPLADLRRIRHTPVNRPDSKIEKAIKSAFRYDPRVKAFKPMVVSQDGVVTLTGMVGNLPAKHAAANIARHTAGVRHVRNLLRVRIEKTPADDVIKKQIQAKLEDSPLVQRHELKVTVDGGVVYLDGSVDSRYQKGQAGFLASTVPGVVAVKNYLVITGDLRREPDWILEERIESNLYWNPEIDSYGITVEVSNGAAKLVGEVESWYERRMAVEAAWRAGPRAVHDKLRVTEKLRWSGPPPAPITRPMPPATPPKAKPKTEPGFKQKASPAEPAK
jgi:osmotically-inducible protein OsmY